MPSQRLADRTPRAPTHHCAKRGGLLLLAAATLLLIPALAFADVPVATISGPEVVAEGSDKDTPRLVTYTVRLTGTGSAQIAIKYTVTGTATEDVDYAKPSGTLEIPEGGTTGEIVINVHHDDVTEVGETLVVTLTEATTMAGTVAIGSPSQVTTMIRSSDTSIVTVTTTAKIEGDDDVTFTLTCAVERRCVPAGANPVRQLSLQPEAVGAVQGGNELD